MYQSRCVRLSTTARLLSSEHSEQNTLLNDTHRPAHSMVAAERAIVYAFNANLIVADVCKPVRWLGTQLFQWQKLEALAIWWMEIAETLASYSWLTNCVESLARITDNRWFDPWNWFLQAFKWLPFFSWPNNVRSLISIKSRRSRGKFRFQKSKRVRMDSKLQAVCALPSTSLSNDGHTWPTKNS